MIVLSLHVSSDNLSTKYLAHECNNACKVHVAKPNKPPKNQHLNILHNEYIWSRRTSATLTPRYCVGQPIKR